MKAIIVGGGIGGLVTGADAARARHRLRGLRAGGCDPRARRRHQHAAARHRRAGRLGLLERLDAVAIRTYELFYLNRFGQEIWREPRGLDAGYEVPQFSIHRGRLQGVIRDAVIERLGADAVRTGCRLGAFRQDEGGVTAWFFDRLGSHVATTRGDVLSAPTASTRACARRSFPTKARRAGTASCCGAARPSGRRS